MLNVSFLEVCSPYVLVFLLLIGLAYRESMVINNIALVQKNKRCAFALLVVFMGLRAYVSTDFINYYPYFMMIDDWKSLPEIILIKGWEPGFIIYTYVCKMIIPSYFAWNFISTCIDLFILNEVLKRYTIRPVLVLVFFFAIGGLALEFNVLRNAKAVFVFLLSLKYIQEKNLIKYSICIAIAGTFHTSAFIYLPLYFVLNKRWPKWLIASLAIGGLVVYFGHISFIGNLLSRLGESNFQRMDYLMEHYSENGERYTSIVGNIIRVFEMCLLILTYDKLFAKNKRNLIFANMFILVYISFFYLAENATFVQRFQYMFIPSYWFVYPKFLSYFSQHKNNLIIVLLFLITFSKIILIGNNKREYYENCLLPHSSYNERCAFTIRVKE